MSFVKLPVDWGEFNPDENIWILNPQLKYYKPYSTLYDMDESEGKNHSSLQMWVVFFMCHPDENENLFFRMSEKERKTMLTETYFKGDWSEPVFNDCLDSYPQDCMTAVQRAYSIEVESLRKRAKLIDKTELTLDYTDVSPEGKTFNVKGTASQINVLQKDSLKVYENYDKIREKYIQEKEEMTAHGAKLKQTEKDKNFW